MTQVLLFTECNGSPGWGRDAGCYSIASRLREAGLRTKVIDFFSFFDRERMQKAVDLFVSNETLVVGFSSTHFSSFLPADFNRWMAEAERSEKNSAWNTYFPFAPELMEEFFSRIKRKNPLIKIIVGGQKVVQKRKLQERHPGVDIWIEGMADVSMVKVCQQLAKDRQWSRRRVKSEDEFAEYAEFSQSKIHWQADDYLFPGEALPLEISRGCPFRCTFCDYKKKVRGQLIKEASVLRDQILEMHQRFGISHYMITDFLVNEDPQKMEMVWKVFTGLPFKIEWSGFARLDLLERWPEMRDMIYESGARSVMWGIESLSGDVGRLIRKNCDVDLVTKLLRFCKDQWKDEVIVGSGFIVGLPGETRESMAALLKWIIDHPELLHGFEITPLFIGAYNPEKASRIAYADIQVNPQKFGYDVRLVDIDGKNVEEWENRQSGLTKADCVRAIEELQRSSAWGSRKVLGTYHSYSRLRNLGFNHQELLHAHAGNPVFMDRAQKLFFHKAETYLTRVFGE